MLEHCFTSTSEVWRLSGDLTCSIHHSFHNKMLLVLPAILWMLYIAAVLAYEDEFKQSNELNCDMYKSTEGINFKYVRCRSDCQPRETLVNVWHEFPEEMHNIIFPCSVPVQRCAGYCGDEALLCVAEKNYTVVVQVKRVYTDETIELPFVAHSDCRCKRSLTDSTV